MPVKIRLTRHGRKGRPYYHIVIADSRAPRDGRYIERIGSYNPITNPATINLNFEKALEWLQNGAQPTDTCRAILSYKGVMMKKHLLEGVKKGAFDEAAAESKFEAWMREKEAKIEAKKEKLSKDASDKIKKRLEAEAKVSSDRGEALAKKLAEAAVKESSEEVKEAVVSEPKTEEPKTEEVKAEEPKAEEPKAEEPKTEEPKAEEPKADETEA